MNEYQIDGKAFLSRWLLYSVLVWPFAIFCGGVFAFAMSIFFATVEPLQRSDLLAAIIGFMAVPIMGMIVGFCVGQLQRALLRKRLYWAADRWRTLTLVGGAIGAVVYVLVSILVGDPFAEDSLMLAMPLFIVCVSVMQWFQLRQAVRSAWLWIVSNLVGGMVFTGLIFMNQPVDGFYSNLIMLGIWLIAIVAQGAITGQIMLYLFQTQLYPMQPEDVAGDAPEKPKSVWDEAI